MILGLYSTHTMNVIYRLRTPLRAIGGDIALINRVQESQLRAADTVVIHAMGGRVKDVRDAFASIRSYGVRRVLVDYDDAIFEPHPFADVRPEPFQLDGVRAALELCDGVIVTSDYLRSHFAAHTDKPIRVVPNLIDPRDWPNVPPPQDTPPTIVIAGSPSHQYDWDMVVPAMLQIRQQLPDVQIRLLGCPHPDLKQIATQGGGGWLSPTQYKLSLAGGSIGLCPLPETPFNLGKSPIKALEYSLAAGMAVIGSETQYRDVLADQRGYVIPDDRRLGWEIAIGVYLCDPERRMADATRLRAHILDAYNVHNHTDILTMTYLEDIHEHIDNRV